MLATMSSSDQFRGHKGQKYGDVYCTEQEADEVKCKRRKRRRNQMKRIPLWYFLYELLCMDISQQLVQWSGKHPYEFTIKAPQEVAELWGQMKEKSNMTYAKLARGIRYYYGKGVIEKVPRSRFSYRFILSRKTSCFLGKSIHGGGQSMPRLGSLPASYCFPLRTPFSSAEPAPSETPSFKPLQQQSFFGRQSPLQDRKQPKRSDNKPSNFVDLYSPFGNNAMQEEFNPHLIDFNSLVEAVEDTQIEKLEIKQEVDESSNCALSEGSHIEDKFNGLWDSVSSKEFEDMINIDDLTTIKKDEFFGGWAGSEASSEAPDSKDGLHSPDPLESKYEDLHDWISSGRPYLSRDTKTLDNSPVSDNSPTFSDTAITFNSPSFLQSRTRCRTASTESTSTTSSGNWGGGSHDFDVRDRSNATNQRILKQLCNRLEDHSYDFDSDSDESLYSP